MSLCSCSGLLHFALRLGRKVVLANKVMDCKCRGKEKRHGTRQFAEIAHYYPAAQGSPVGSGAELELCCFHGVRALGCIAVSSSQLGILSEVRGSRKLPPVCGGNVNMVYDF